jgi:hypothetical protein
LLFNKTVKVGDIVHNQVVLKEPIDYAFLQNNIVHFSLPIVSLSHLNKPLLSEGFENDWKLCWQ